MDFARLTARGMRDLAASGEVSPSELVQASLDRIDALDSRIGAFLDVDREGALARAHRLEEERAKGKEPGPLYGVPIGLKDNLSLQGRPLTCASRILQGYTASYNATSVQRLLNAGAIPVGRCNMDEFAFGASTEHSAYQKTHNPWNLDRIPGGSSGGSAAAVAARMVPLALGSDTGGSIRQPAALCGVTGIKPTYGRVSRFGLVAFASSLDQIGPISLDVADSALALSVLSGHDNRDATSLDVPAFAEGEIGRGVEGLRIGVPREHFDEQGDPEIQASVRAALDRLADAGAELVEIRLPTTPQAIPTYYLVAASEASSNLARFDGIRYGHRSGDTDLLSQYMETRGEGFGEETKRRILLGVFCLSAGYYDQYYLRATKVRTLLRREFEAAFAKVDVICGPTTSIPAYELGETVDDPYALYLCDLLTAPANLTGIPGLSVPCGFDSVGMPIGMQLLGPVLGEGKLYQVAQAWQDISQLDQVVAKEVIQ